MKEDLFTWESVYPTLNSQVVLVTLMALWDYETKLTLTDIGTVKHGARGCQMYLKHPDCPPPPPPCQLDGVEYELETMSIPGKTMCVNTLTHIESFDIPSTQTPTKSLNDKHVLENGVCEYPFPDLIPESFDNRQQHIRTNQTLLKSKEDISRNAESWFLISVIIGSLMILYLLPTYES